MADWVALLLGVILTAGTAVFVASEFALVTLDPALVEHKATDRRSRIVVRSLRRLSGELSSAQVGITVTTILLGFISQPALTRIFRQVTDSWRIAESLSVAVAAAFALLCINVFSMLFGELVPKNYAIADPWGVAVKVVPLQRVFSIVFRPLIGVLDGSANAILRRCGIEPRSELSGARSAPELAALVKRSAEMGTLESGVARLLTNSIELDELTAVDVMTDRTRMVTVSSDDCAADIVMAARNTGHSRFPVCGTSRDDIVGFVHVRKALTVPRDRRARVPVTGIMDEAHQVPETVALRNLLVDLRETGLQIAVVVDEYGGTSGIVTLEDVVEELVGDVADEHDARRVGVLAAGDAWIVAGVMRPDEVFEHTGIELPVSPVYETVGGLVMANLGRVAQVGDTIEVPVPAVQGRASATQSGGPASEQASREPGRQAIAQLRVEVMAARRIVQVRLRVVSRPTNEGR